MEAEAGPVLTTRRSAGGVTEMLVFVNPMRPQLSMAVSDRLQFTGPTTLGVVKVVEALVELANVPLPTAAPVVASVQEDAHL